MDIQTFVFPAMALAIEFRTEAIETLKARGTLEFVISDPFEDERGYVVLIAARPVS